MADQELSSKACVSCHAQFVPAPGRGRPRIRCVSCSPLQLGLSAGKSVAKRISAICADATCQRPFVSAGDFGQRFCSRQCGVRASNIAQQFRRRDRSARSCKGCGARFAPTYGDLRREYCSVACRTAHWYQMKAGHTHERRARKFGCESEKVDKFRVFERDGWACRICGVPTPRELSGTKAANAPELDHIVPLSKGGPHSYANTQCACRRCNSRKGNRLPNESRI